MGIREIKNICSCVILPMIIGGLVSLGFVTLFKEPLIPLIFFGGGLSYIAGDLIRSIFNWEEKETSSS